MCNCVVSDTICSKNSIEVCNLRVEHLSSIHRSEIPYVYKQLSGVLFGHIACNQASRSMRFSFDWHEALIYSLNEQSDTMRIRYKRHAALGVTSSSSENAKIV
jgi:hypothetical protein